MLQVLKKLPCKNSSALREEKGGCCLFDKGKAEKIGVCNKDKQLEKVGCC